MKGNANKTRQTFHGFNDLIIYFSTITKLITFTNGPNAIQIKFTWITLRLKVNAIELWFRYGKQKFIPNQIVKELFLQCGFSLLSIIFPKYSLWTTIERNYIQLEFVSYSDFHDTNISHLWFPINFVTATKIKFNENFLKLKARKKKFVHSGVNFSVNFCLWFIKFLNVNSTTEPDEI